MIWRFAFGFLPVPVFYTDSLPAGFAGQCVCYPWPAIRVRPEYKDDVPLHLHELTHCRQTFLTVFLHPMLQKYIRAYRQWAEVAAYKVQIAARSTGASIDFAVKALATKYNLGISEVEARALLVVK